MFKPRFLIKHRRNKSGVSIRSSILRSFTILIILILVSFSAVILVLQYSELSVLSRRLVMEAVRELETELHEMFQPVIKNINITAHWGRSNQYNHLETREMLKMFIPILNEYDHIVRIKSSDGDGNGFSLRKEGGNWVTKRTFVDQTGQKALVSYWTDDLELTDERWFKPEFDLREERWYQSIIYKDAYRLGWNEPYFMEDTNELVITGSIKVESGQGELFVLAFDILLDDLQTMMQETVLSKNGIVFIATMDDRFIAMSGNALLKAELNQEDIALKPIGDFDFPQVKALLKEWDDKTHRRLSKVVYFPSAGERWVGMILPFPSQGIPILKIGMQAPMSDVMHYDITRAVSIVLIFILALLLAVIMTKKMAKRYINPIKQILDQSIRISQGDLRKGEPIVCNIKELKQLADTHETMRQALDDYTRKLRISNEKLEEYSQTLSEKVEERTYELNRKSEELEELNRTLEERVKKEVEANIRKDQLMLRSARQAQMGEMLSMIAHQWRQPLSSISTITGNLMVYLELDTYDKEQFMEMLASINDHAQFLSRTINDFRHFFNPNKKKEHADLKEILEQTINIIGRSLEYKNIDLQRDVSFNSTIATYPNEITQVFLNIIKNAQDVIVEKEIENPKIRITGYEEGNCQVVEIADNAGGIPEESLDKIFDPYFSTKDEKTGTGLGLYMSKLIIEKHCKGKLIAENRDDGACFIISMPKLKMEEI